MAVRHKRADMDCCEEHIVHMDAVETARRQMPDDDITTAASDFFKAFSDKTRLRILTALVSAELCVCDIATLLGMSQSAISHQLRFLKQARLVKSRKNGTIIVSHSNEMDDTIDYFLTLHEGNITYESI